MKNKLQDELVETQRQVYSYLRMNIGLKEKLKHAKCD